MKAEALLLKGMADISEVGESAAAIDIDLGPLVVICTNNGSLCDCAVMFTKKTKEGTAILGNPICLWA